MDDILVGNACVQPNAATLDTASRPILGGGVTFSAQGQDVLVSGSRLECVFGGDSAKALWAVRHRLDGSLSVRQLALSAGISGAEMLAILNVLQAESLLIDAQEALGGCSVGRFLEIYDVLCR